MVGRSQDYSWSSYHANGLGRADGLITPHEKYLRLGRSDAERRAAYRALVGAPANETLTGEIRDATHGNFALGGKPFHAQIAKALGTRVTRGVAGRPFAAQAEVPPVSMAGGKQRELL